ncbi:hypothetical protein, partial [Salinivibrio sp. HTSP]|uniref:hypothetical protein n=1 Tax=Salinivibrio sp. HTSP TaxID=2115977 RepID=UPI00138FFF9F
YTKRFIPKLGAETRIKSLHVEINDSRNASASFFDRFKRIVPTKNGRERLYRQNYFWECLKELNLGLSSQQQSSTFSDAVSFVKEYNELLESHISKLDDLEKKLKSALNKNSLEEYKIDNMPILGRGFYKTYRNIKTIKALNFQEFNNIGENIPHALTLTLYIATICYMITTHDTWGEI